MAVNPTIVVCAYNRVASLSRLLDSLQKANYPSEAITLVISIDKSESDAVYQFAKDFFWTHGKKQVIHQNKKLGLKSHVLACADLSLEHGSIILLEDDLLVSPFFYDYAISALSFYKTDERIAGISLYSYRISESSFYPFEAIDDGSDAYFMQIASSWGQVWTSEQWQAFKDWFVDHPSIKKTNSVPTYIEAWGEESWKKHFINYLVSTDKYFVFPRVSFSTNFEEPGMHSTDKKVFQVPIQFSKRNYSFQNLKESKSIYDAWFEISAKSLIGWCPSIASFDFSVDLYGIKELHKIGSEYLLTSKEANLPTLSFSNELFPPESNIICNLPGTGLSLFKIEDNRFRSTKIKLQHALEDRNSNHKFNYSIIVLIDEYVEEKLSSSLKEISIQPNIQYECLIICPSIAFNKIEFFCKSIDLNVKIITYKDKKPLIELLEIGFNQSKCEIITWIIQGSQFSGDCFEKVDRIFSDNANLNWLIGSDEPLQDGKINYRFNSSVYRLNGNDAYCEVKNNSLKIPLELSFFKAAAIKNTFHYNNFQELFLNLISVYQLTVVLYQFGIRAQNNLLPKLMEKEKRIILQRFSHLKPKQSITMKMINFCFYSSFRNNNRLRLIYPILNHYPDVLIYDKLHGTFYFSRV